ncbi:MAG: ABC transporter substrate-binding protein [Halanaeroarchaeum sp.]
MVSGNRFSVDRRTVLKTIGAGSLVGVAGCTGGGDSGPYTIGMVDSRTGSLSAFGERNKRGLEIALTDINDVRVGGRELDVTVEDSQSKAQSGVSAAQKLVNQDGVPLMIGAVGSGVSLAIYQSVVQNTDVVQVSQNSTSPKLTDYPGLLRMSPTGRTQSKAIADLIKEDGHESVAMTWINNDYGQGIAEAFVNAWGSEPAYNSPHDQGQSSYSSVVSEMGNADADAWVFITYQPEFTTMAQEAYSKGLSSKVQFYGADSVKGPKVIQNTPEGSLKDMKIVAPSAALDQENYKNFASTFKDDYDTEPTAWSAYTYDAVMTAGLAIMAADEFTGSALSKVVRDVTRPEGKKVYTFKAASDILSDGGSAADVNYEGVSGPIDLDENGDPKAYLQVFTVNQNHEYESTGFISA